MISVIHLKELCDIIIDVVILKVILDLFDRDEAASINVQIVKALEQLFYPLFAKLT